MLSMLFRNLRQFPEDWRSVFPCLRKISLGHSDFIGTAVFCMAFCVCITAHSLIGSIFPSLLHCDQRFVAQELDMEDIVRKLDCLSSQGG